MDVESDLSKTRGAVVVQDLRVRDPDHDRALDLVADPAPAQGIIVVLEPDQGTVGGDTSLLLIFMLFIIPYILRICLSSH